MYGRPIQSPNPNTLQSGNSGMTTAWQQSGQGSQPQMRTADQKGVQGAGGGSWVNLQNYLGLGGNMADKVLNPIEQQGEALKTQASQQGGYLSGGTATAQSPGYAAIKGPQVQPQFGGVGGMGLAVTPSDTSAIANAGFLKALPAPAIQAGPSADQTKAVTQTQDQANLLGTTQGQQALLQKAYGGDAAQGYGPGSSGLDALLFGASAGDRAAKDKSDYGNLERLFVPAQSNYNPTPKTYTPDQVEANKSARMSEQLGDGSRTADNAETANSIPTSDTNVGGSRRRKIGNEV